MKLLVYLSPWAENEKSSQGRYDFLKEDFKRFLNNLNVGCMFNGDNLEVKLICSPSVSIAEAKVDFLEGFIDPVFVSAKESQSIFSSQKEYMNVHGSSPSKKEEDKIISFFKERLFDFTPDLVLAITPGEFFKKLFPESLYYIMEAGFFSRAPYPYTQSFDTNSSLDKTLPVKFKNELSSLKLNDQQQEFVDAIREKYISLFKESSSLTRKDLDPQELYSKVVLLPLQFENSPSFDFCCNFKNQYELLEYVLSHMSEDTLLVVTKHQFTQINTEEVSRDLGQKYKNFKFIDHLNGKTEFLSQELLRLVDCVVTVSSSIGMQASLWKKPCICIGNSHIRAFTDNLNIRDIESLLLGKSICADKDNVIYYLLTHYYVPFDWLWSKPQWVYDFLKNSIEKYQSKASLNSIDFYDRVDTDKNLLAFYLTPRMDELTPVL